MAGSGRRAQPYVLIMDSRAIEEVLFADKRIPAEAERSSGLRNGEGHFHGHWRPDRRVDLSVRISLFFRGLWDKSRVQDHPAGILMATFGAIA